tara:strand:- start:22646 stop:23014 length:369 start_codon:yes stop_codon:yes gene_type:complete
MMSRAIGNDGGQFEGAIWKFTLTSKNTNKKLKGQFRVSNKVLYQKVNKEDPTFTKPIGKNYPKKTKTKIQFTDLRAFTSKGVQKNGIQATVWLKYHRFGHWSGTFIDGKGAHWNIKCVRFQE